MAKQGKSSKKGRNTRSPSMAAYKAEGRLLKNKKRRARRGDTPKGTTQDHYAPKHRSRNGGAFGSGPRRFSEYG